MGSKKKAGYALKLFCQDFDVPEELKFNGSKEHACKQNTFMKEVRRQGIDYHISEPDLNNQNPVEGVIREVIWKWYQTMVRKRAPRQLWDYGVSWVSKIISMTHYYTNSINGGINLTNTTGKTVDISE